MGAVQLPDQHIGQLRQAANQIELLEHHVHACTHATHVVGNAASALHHPVVDADFRSGVPVRRDQPGQMAHEGGLARTGRADERHDFSLADVQIDVAQGMAAIGEVFVQSVDGDGM